MGATIVTVCLPPTAAADVPTALDVALRPFEAMQGYPDGRDIWESWRIWGGSEGQGFRIRAGYEDHPGLIHDHAPEGEPPPPSLPGMCAGGPLFALDLAGPYAEAARRAERDWDTWNELARTHPAAHSFAELLEK